MSRPEDSEQSPDRVSGRRLIKRYANRKLYDTTSRAFTSLSAIRRCVQRGEDVVVLDHGTGADRTVEILSHALTPTRRCGPSDVDEWEDDHGMGAEVLAELIRAPGRLAQIIADAGADSAAIASLRKQVYLLGQILDDVIASRAGDLDQQASRRPA